MEIVELKLGKLADAKRIGSMSRALIERRLPWSWDSARIEKEIRCRDSVVLTAWNGKKLIGFAIMRFCDESAHLNLLAVDSIFQGLGVGRHLLAWLEQTARVAGVFIVSLEVRANNSRARAFYRRRGFVEIARIPRYYAGRETAIRMTRDLHCSQAINAS